MQLNKILDEIISKEVYEEVKVERKLYYHPSELTKDIVEKNNINNGNIPRRQKGNNAS
jgi:hypothetical protein